MFGKDKNKWPDNLNGRSQTLYKVFHTTRGSTNGVDSEVKYFLLQDSDDAFGLVNKLASGAIDSDEITTTTIRWIDFNKQEEQLLMRFVHDPSEGSIIMDNKPKAVEVAPVWATLESYNEIKKDIIDGTN